MSWSLWQRFIWDDTSTHPPLNVYVLVYVANTDYLGIRKFVKGDPDIEFDHAFNWLDTDDDYDDYLAGSSENRVHWTRIPERP